MTDEKDKPKIKSLRTYKGDIEAAIIENNTSASSILIDEQKRKDLTVINPEEEEARGAKNKFFILVGSLLLLLGIITIIAVYYVRSNEKVAVEKQTKALISFSEEKTLSVIGSTREKIISDIKLEKQIFNRPINSVLYLNTADPLGVLANVETLLSLIAPRMPAELSRSFESKYMLGIYSFDTNEPFIILTTNDYPASYSGMLKWEKDMALDLGSIFGIADGSIFPGKSFVDEAVHNKDLRVLKNNEGKIAILYSFIDKNTLVITGSENVFTSIVSKYIINKQVR